MGKTDYKEAMELLIENVSPIGTCMVGLDDLYGRILAEDLLSGEDVPYFAKSPYDGYAFRAGDTSECSKENPVTLKVIENIKAGQCAKNEVISGTAVRLMTGAPLPKGADAICKYEDTSFTESEVTIFRPYAAGENVIMIGEDFKKGTVLATKGTRVDIGIIGTASSLGFNEIKVYKRPVAGILSTGDEIVDSEEEMPYGKIRNSNRYTIAAALNQLGFDTVYLGRADDNVTAIAELISKGEEIADIIISTGGVSVGDYDLVPDAMEGSGYEILVRGVRMKPGMACADGLKEGKVMLALSGNPASSLTNLQCICYPALKKLAGYRDYDHKLIKLKLKNECKKAGKGTRFLRGRLELTDGEAFLDFPKEQGNVVISSAAFCNAYGIVADMQAPVPAGTLVDAFLI